MNVRKRVVGQSLGHAPLDQIGRRVHRGGAQIVENRSRLPIGRAASSVIAFRSRGQPVICKTLNT